LEKRSLKFHNYRLGNYNRFASAFKSSPNVEIFPNLITLFESFLISRRNSEMARERILNNFSLLETTKTKNSVN
jgi:hypothetical protein